MKLNCYITNNGILIKQNDIDNIFSKTGYNAFIKKLKVENIKTIGKRKYKKTLLLYKLINSPDGKTFLNIPRFVDLKLMISSTIEIKYHNLIKSGEDILNKIGNDSVDLKIGQKLCLDYLLHNYFNEDKVKKGLSSCIFVMATGLGKTYVSAALIEKLHEKTLVIIPNKANIEGWYDPFKFYLKNITVGEYNSSRKEDGDIIIMTIDSALSKNLPNDYFKQFGFIIYDEIHNYPTNTYQEIFWKCNFKYCLGLTATPDERGDVMDKVYYNHVGDVVKAIDIPGFNDAIDTVNWIGSVTLIKYYGLPEYTVQHKNAVGWTDTDKMYKQFTIDPDRTEMLLNLIHDKAQQNKNIFVFAVHRDYLHILHDKYNERFNQNNDYETKIVEFMGGATDETKSIAKNIAQIIFTTFSYAKEGVSIIRMNTIIIAHPIRNKMRQIIGRILRLGGDPTIPREIIDICDMNTTLKSQYSTRKQVYNEKNFPITKKIIKI